jgi:hypothetical protein
LGPLLHGGGDQHGGVAVEAAVEGEHDLGRVVDGAGGVGAGGPGAGRQPGLLELVGVGLAIRTARTLNLPVEPGVAEGRDKLILWAHLLDEVVP